jgi:hypothetical protein
MRQRIAALALLVGLLALPALGLTSEDPCCVETSPCAPTGAHCESVGPVPCCPTAHAGASAPANRISAPVVAWTPLVVRPVAISLRPTSLGPDPDALSPLSALRLSVVLRI